MKKFSDVTRSERIATLLGRLEPLHNGRIPVSITKARSITASFRETEGMPHPIRSAKAFQRVIEEAQLFIEPGSLLVGAGATHPSGVELTALWGTWPDDELDALERDGYLLDPEVRAEIGEINDYWRPRAVTRRMTQTYDDARLWPFAQSGVVLPPFKSKEDGWGPGGLLGAGFGIHHEISQMIGTPDFGKVLATGLGALEAEVRAELDAWRFTAKDSAERLTSLRASLIAVQAVQTLVRRYAEIARADAETADPAWAAELRVIADRCDRLAVEAPATLHDAVQLYWFLYLSMLPSGTLGMGRFDRLFIDFYEADLAAGRTDAQQTVDLFAALRIRSEEVTIQGSTSHRSKWAGGSKWHNAVVGGTDSDGRDVTNDLTHLVMKAAVVCPTPHHTLTLRVHDGTPDEVLATAAELVKSGLGMPAFLNDEPVLEYFAEQGIATAEARDYNVAGSLSVTLTGKSRMVASPMCVVPKILRIALRGGDSPHASAGAPRTRSLAEHTSFDEFLADFDTHLAWYLALQGEFNNVTIQSIGDLFPRPLDSVLMHDGVATAKDVFKRTLPYENSNFVNVIGVVNVGDSLAAIRELVFEQRVVDAGDLLAALDRDWSGEGDERIRDLCLAAPKYGNDDDRVDQLVAWVYARCAEHIRGLGNATGGTCKPSALTIGTSPWPGGLVAGATPDGRRSVDPLAEESMTPMRGSEHGSPWDVVASAAKIDQVPFQVTELDLRFTAEALSEDGAEGALLDLIRTYFRDGGKHVQVNVASERALSGEDTGELIRLGGTSAHWSQLSPSMREEIRKRSYFRAMPPRADAVEQRSA